jgi:hypothetical protein
MNIIVGLIIFALGGFVGICLTTMSFLAYVEAQKHLAVSKSAPQPKDKYWLCPVAVIPITLDENRIVEIGMSQALQEEAARTARWN